MAMNIGKTPIPSTDAYIPAYGSGIAHTAIYDPISNQADYWYGSYNPSTTKSWSGSKFYPGGYPSELWPTRAEGILQAIGVTVPVSPFVMNTLARFPMTQDEMEAAWVTLSSGTISKFTQTATHPGDGTVSFTTPTETTENVYGTIGVARLIDEGGTVIPRIIGKSISTARLDVESAHNIIEQVKTMRNLSRGNCIGFTWFLLPDEYSVASGTEGTDAALKALAGPSSISINGDGYAEGEATVTWIEYAGYSWGTGALQLNAHTCLAPMPGPPPPRFDV